MELEPQSSRGQIGAGSKLEPIVHLCNRVLVFSCPLGQCSAQKDRMTQNTKNLVGTVGGPKPQNKDQRPNQGMLFSLCFTKLIGMDVCAKAQWMVSPILIDTNEEMDVTNTIEKRGDGGTEGPGRGCNEWHKLPFFIPFNLREANGGREGIQIGMYWKTITCLLHHHFHVYLAFYMYYKVQPATWAYF